MPYGENTRLEKQGLLRIDEEEEDVLFTKRTPKSGHRRGAQGRDYSRSNREPIDAAVGTSQRQLHAFEGRGEPIEGSIRAGSAISKDDVKRLVRQVMQEEYKEEDIRNKGEDDLESVSAYYQPLKRGGGKIESLRRSIPEEEKSPRGSYLIRSLA